LISPACVGRGAIEKGAETVRPLSLLSAQR
jgi:hypothetical protein